MVSNIRRDFWQFWDEAPESTRGAWPRQEVGRYQSPAFDNRHILRLNTMVQELELRKFVNLVHMLESQFGGALGAGRGFGAIEIDTILRRVPEFHPLHELLPSIISDLRHREDCHVVGVSVHRRFMQSLPAEKRRENADDHGTTWVLFLNDDYKGGELFWPTREIVLKPKAGTAVRWPSGIPHGIARTDDGYQFCLSAQNVAHAGAHDKRVVLTDEFLA